jgi:hypothetical protein
MREFFRPAAAMLSIACLLSVLALASTEIALAQARQQVPVADPAVNKQIALSEKQIEAVLAAKKDFDAIGDNLPDNVPADQKGLVQLNAVSKKNGFANYVEYAIAEANIRLALAGFDPATKKYVGPEAAIKARIALVQADKRMSADDKQEALGELNEALKSPPPVVSIKANIDLVAKHYDKLNEALADADK